MAANGGCCSEWNTDHRWLTWFALTISDHHFDDAALGEVKGARYGRRWACCQDTDADAPACKSGVHVTYDCAPEQWTEGLKFEVR